MADLLRGLKTGDLALRAQSLALQTTGHNIANAATEGYTRQRVLFTATRPEDQIRFQVGTGVRVDRIERVINESLEVAIQDSASLLESLRAQAEALQQAESVYAQFSDNDLDTALAHFFDALQAFSNNPEELGVRQAVLTEGQALTDTFRFIADRMDRLRTQLNDDLNTGVNQANTILVELAQLNGEIVRLENGGANPKTANDLRDRRDLLLKELSQLFDVRAIEEPTGAILVLAGSSTLVNRQMAVTLETVQRTDRNVAVSDVRIKGGELLPLTGGEFEGIVKTRDTTLTGFVDSLDVFVRTFTDAFNKLHSTGRGLERFTSLVSRVGLQEVNETTVALAVRDTVTAGGNTATTLFSSGLAAAPLADDVLNNLKLIALSGPNAGQERRIVDFNGVTGQVTFESAFGAAFQVGDRFAITSADFAPEDGSFDLVITSELTGETKTFNIGLDLDGVGADSTLSTVVAEINAELTAFYGAGVPLVASINSSNQLSLARTSTAFSFSFASDTSGFVASMGLGTFFAGRTARVVGLDPAIGGKPQLVAGARSNAPGDNTNALALIGLRETKLFTNGTATPEDFMRGVVGSLAIETRKTQDLLQNQARLDTNLRNQREALSGVNLDEEAVNLITHQRAFQAAARYISVVNDMLGTLLNI